jgi:hypothetical protein
MHAISRGCTVSRAFSFSCQTFRSLFFFTRRRATNTIYHASKNEVVRCGTCYVWNGKILSKQGARMQKATLKW